RQALMMEANDLGETDPPSSLGPDLRQDVERAIRASLVNTFRWAAFICAALAGLGSLVALIWIAPGPRHKSRGDDQSENVG
ncbi:MAG: hypothetical protein R3191_00585, partial [Anaerolineales bacterium]|nr:hypothetical protein [Anaerolineales bacterium]